MQKSTIISIIISAALIGGTLYMISDRQPLSNGGETVQTQNVEVRDGVQYVTISAKGGYAPRVTEIKSDLPTKLVVKTNGTYDCSASLVIHSLGVQKILQPTGEEVIDLGTPKSGDEFQGLCSMGMFNFLIKAS